MDNKHRRRLLVDYPGETKFLPVEVLHILDDYQFMDPEFVQLVRDAAESITRA